MRVLQALFLTSIGKAGVLVHQSIPKDVGSANRRSPSRVGRFLTKEEQLARIDRRLSHLVMQVDRHLGRSLVGGKNPGRVIHPHGIGQRVLVGKGREVEQLDEGMEVVRGTQRQPLKQNDTTIGCLGDQLVPAGGNPLGDFGNASSHSWRNLPILLAGGGYKHGSHDAHDKENNTPFANLFVPLARRMGLELDQFGSSTKSTIRGLES